MVTLNFTLFIELGLFLLFLWGTARFILRPVIQNLDQRSQQIEEDHATAARESEEAKAVDAQYAEGLSEARQITDETYQQARRETLKGHLDAVTNARSWADEAVAEARVKGQNAIEQEREALQESVPEIADLIVQRLRPEGPSV